MPRLIDRNKQIPNGLTFFQPQTGWRPPRYASFSQIVLGLKQHRNGNALLTQKIGWALDEEGIAGEVDQYNAMICKEMGWTDYYVDEGGPPPPPKWNPPVSLLGRAGQLAAGLKTTVKWIRSGAEAVAPELANSRAAWCVKCPVHGKGGLDAYFTEPAQAAIQFELNQRREWKLSTPSDGELRVCEACSCPMKLKVHMPIKNILADMPADSKAALHPECWILKEEKQP